MSAAAFAAVMMLTCTPGGAEEPGYSLPQTTIVRPEAAASLATDQALPALTTSGVGPQSTEPSPPQPPAADNDIVVSARRRSPGDPLAAINQQSFAATQAVDRAVVGPVALTFEHVVPKPARDGLRNFFINLHEPIVFVNYLLQLKPGKAAETAGRFLINSTVGVAGLVDVAKRRPINLPRRKNNFADTLGYYGVRPGPFLFLPLIGPTTLRDLLGGGVDRLMMPLYLGAPFNRPIFNVGTGGVHMLDRRAEFDDQLNQLRAARNPYIATRSYYLWRRQAEIDGLHGRKSAPFDLDPGNRAPPASATAPRTTTRSALPAVAPTSASPVGGISDK